MGQLSERSVRSAKPGRHMDGDGLYLDVSETGRRTWTLRFQRQGRRRDMGLGSYPTVGLAAARDKAADARRLLAQGKDPIETRKLGQRAANGLPTVAQIAAIVIPQLQEKSANAKVQRQLVWYLGPENLGPIWNRPVNEITSSDMANLLRPMVEAKPEKSRRMRSYLRRLFDHARVVMRDRYGVVMNDPVATADLRALGVDRGRKLTRGHHAALDHRDVAAFVAELRKRDSVSARALEFLILTVTRTDSTLNARHADIDLDAKLWTIPLEHLKDKKHRTSGFRVPLSERVVQIVKEMQPLKSEYLFPSFDSGPLSNMALLTFIRRQCPGWTDPETKRAITPHGFRATFKTWCEEESVASHSVVEESLGHAVGGTVERAYRRTDVLAKRRALMQAWADYCELSNDL